jgi:hypothetical protein
MAWLGEKVFGNFRPTVTERAKAKRMAPKDKRAKRPGNSEAHLAALRKCPCVVTLKVPAGEVHHLKMAAAGQERGMGQRASDRFGLPLSRTPHDELESIGSRHEPRWFAERGVDEPIELAAALWAVRPADNSEKAIRMAVAAMTRIIVAHRRSHCLSK